jgi:uncharacterized membrane protein HdeD (DUF308 family)
MLKQRVLSPQVAMHHRQLVAREAVLLLGVTFIALLLQVGGHQISLLLLDGALIASGFLGLLTALFLAGNADRWWFIGLATITMIAGLTQLFWSSGLAVGLLVLIAIPPILDALANVVILALHFWPGSQHDT